MDAVDACLSRLDTDYIDLYQVHMPDSDTPQEETLRALDDIVRAGKVRYIGCSNYAGWQVADADWIAKSEHLTPFVSAQNQYSLLERGIERELMPACKQFELGILPFFPLASGFLTGKYRPNEAAPEGARLAGQSPMAGRILNDKNYDSW
jgi:aryl-alcohol dehydrogenase-like predicted oxidoreductase